MILVRAKISSFKILSHYVVGKYLFKDKNKDIGAIYINVASVSE